MPQLRNIEKLIELVEILRGENGCPWDRKQTPRSMAAYLAEEVFELIDAIESGDAGHIREELGDVFFHIVFIARLFQETGDFDIEDAAGEINEKMIRRHPHVFGEKKVENVDEVITNWQEIKNMEKKSAKAKNSSPLDSILSGLPSMMRAKLVLNAAGKEGGGENDVSGALEKARGRFSELEKALSNGNSCGDIDGMFGNVMFSLVDAARLAGVDPEISLTGSVRRFEEYFRNLPSS